MWHKPLKGSDNQDFFLNLTATENSRPVDGHRDDWVQTYPGYKLHLRRKAEMLRKQLSIPYFRSHDGMSGALVSIEGRSLVNFSSYDYLGLSGNAEVLKGAKMALDRYGTSVSASRIVSGEIPLHYELEKGLATALGVEDAMVFVSGYGANVSTIGHLMGPHDLILLDQQIHNSIQTGAKLSGATCKIFRHNDLDHLEKILTSNTQAFQRTLIVIEGAYSMDGDIPDLPRILELKRRHGALLMVDEAHSLGVLGPSGLGIAQHFGIDPLEVEIWMGSLSKSLASSGGYIAGNRSLIEYLKFTAPGFVFSVGLGPAELGAALTALTILLREPQRSLTVQANAQLFRYLARQQGLNTGVSDHTAVVPVIIGNPDRCLILSHHLFELGINVFPILPPGVTFDNSRLRFFMSCDHTEDQIHRTVNATAQFLNG